MTRSSGEKMVQGAAAASSDRPVTALRFTLVRLRPAGRICASTSVGLSRLSISARTIALSAPVRTMASGGAPRKERRGPEVGQGLEHAGLPGAVRAR